MKKHILIYTICPILFIGCTNTPQSIPTPNVPINKSNFISPSDSNLTNPLDTNIAYENNNTTPVVYSKPKKTIKLKKVEDENFTPSYMYLEEQKEQHTTTKPQTPTPTIQSEQNNITDVTEEECIMILGEDRFNRYIEMLGSTQKALKRCQMIQANS